MARFLSTEWFAEVAAAGEPNGADEAGVVLEQVVEGTPDGQVVYRVMVSQDRARIVWPSPADAPAPDLRISCGWDTAVAIARGDISTQRALMDGRLRVKGSPAARGGIQAAVDPVPPSVRAATTYQ